MIQLLVLKHNDCLNYIKHLFFSPIIIVLLYQLDVWSFPIATQQQPSSSYPFGRLRQGYSKLIPSLFLLSQKQQVHQHSFLQSSSSSSSLTESSSNNTVVTASSFASSTNQTVAQQQQLASSSSYKSLVKMSIKTIGSSTTILVSGIFFIVLAIKRDALMVSFFIGAIMNGILSKVLKKLIAQTRPMELQSSQEIVDKPNDHGMPSSHAMSLGFIATFIGCVLIPLRIPLALYTIISLYYRIQVKLHTWEQVLVGTIIGSTNGYMWYQLCIGNNPYKIHIMNTVTEYFLNEQGQLPIVYMIVPFVVGAATIGSFERRIGKLLRKFKSM